MKKSNETIRKRIVTNSLKYWEVAEKTDITAGTFTVWLRTELKDEQKRRVENAIDTLIAKKKEGN